MRKRTLFILMGFIALNAGTYEGQCDDMYKTEMVYIEGGRFMMGDLFDEGKPLEKPVHPVTLDGFYLGKCEVTVGEFRAFVDEMGYKSSAEGPQNREEQKKLMEVLEKGGYFSEASVEVNKKFLSYSGTYCLDGKTNSWSFKHDLNWKNPCFEQSGNDPVTAVSWIDAVNYCNWLSRQESLPPAYDTVTGELLDKHGKVTLDVTLVTGYRLPTEAEWEYAAREGGKRVRFGNGKDVARSGDINFNSALGEFDYAEMGEVRAKTVPVGSFEPNSLGLCDMSGNVWEWCSDFVTDYVDGEQTNPYSVGTYKGISIRAARGGRWGGDANELRAAKRFGWEEYNRCNNIGFRVARSK